MSVLGPQPKDKVKLSRALKVARNGHVKVQGSSAAPDQLEKGTKGVVDKVGSTTVTVSVEWQGDLTLVVDKAIWGTTFEDQKASTGKDKVKLNRALKIGGGVKLLTQGAALTELPKGMTAQLVKSDGRRVVLSLTPPGSKTEVRIELDIAACAKAFDPA